MLMYWPRVLSVPQHARAENTHPAPILLTPEGLAFELASIGVGAMLLGLDAAIHGQEPGWFNRSERFEPVHAPLTDEFVELLRGNDIDLKQVVREEFTAEILRSKAFAEVVDEGRAYAVFHLVIKDVGLAATSRMDASQAPLRPHLNVEATLHARYGYGTLLWRKSATVDGLTTELPAHRFEEYRADPQLVRDVFRQAAALVAADLLKKIDER